MAAEAASFRRLLEQFWRVGVAAVQPGTLISRHASCSGGGWSYHRGAVTIDVPLPDSPARIVVAGAGKAVAPFAQSMARSLGRALDSGLVITKTGHAGELVDSRIRVLESAHPVPDARSEAAAIALERFVGSLCPADVLFCLVTGGASALVAAPAEGISLADKQVVTRLLLERGADIQAINTLRRHLSRLKGGGLLRAAGGARVVTLAVSDVIGDDPAAIGSGLTVADPTTFAEAVQVAAKFGVLADGPAAVARRLHAGAAGDLDETLKPGDPCLTSASFHILARLADALGAAADEARARGFVVQVLQPPLHGDVDGCARRLVGEAGRLARRATGPWLLVAGGEPEVVLTGRGRGGRNQHLALLLARRLSGQAGVHALIAATDGTDGPTGAAGAFVTPDTLARARAAGLVAAQVQAQNDSGSFFDRLGDLFTTGPTGTNVMDLVLIAGDGVQSREWLSECAGDV